MSSGSNKRSPTQSKTSPAITTTRKKREILTTENSLNPILRINRNAAVSSPSTATANVTADSSSSIPSSPTSTRSSAIPIARSRKLSNAKDRHRKTSSTDSLRRAIESQRPASPLAPSLTASQGQPSTSSIRRASSSSSQSARPYDLGSLPVRPGTPAPAVHTDIPFPTSPTPSNSSFTSTAASFDSLKSSLRDTLQSAGQTRSKPTQHRKTRSVSFAVEEGPSTEGPLQGSDVQETQETETPLKQEVSGSNTSGTPTSVHDDRVHVIDFVTHGKTSSDSPRSTASSPMTSVFSSPVMKRSGYPVQHWEPISPSTGEITEEERAVLPGPLDLARSLFVGMAGAPEPDKAVPREKMQSSASGRKVRKETAVVDRGILWMTFQTLVGLWLVVIWLVVGRLFGPSKRSSK